VTSTDASPGFKQQVRSHAKAAFAFVRRHRWSTAAVVLLTLVLVPATVVYVHYYRIVSRTLRNGPFANTSNIYSAPRVLVPGEEISPESIASGLERAGYTTSVANSKGWYRAGRDSVEVHPGPDSYFEATPALVKFKKGQIGELSSLSTNTRLEQYELEPELITNLVDGDREKRRLVQFHEIPPVLVHAVVSAEDKRFFEHIGFDPLRLAKAAYVDAKAKRKEQGASTITMQLARALWLDPEKRWKRKFSELMMTLILEQRLSKQDIFQFYANQVYLGENDSYSIHGFGEAARTLFDKDISQLTLPEAALLAGMIQRPSYFNPVRSPQRAKDRRNIILRLMQDNHYINATQYAAALNEPIRLAPRKLDTGDAPYFLALMNDELGQRLPDSDEDSTALQVYSTLDPDLQHAATESVRQVMPKIDALVKAKKIAKDGVFPQVALVALDPHTGEVKALVGGRDYAKSQLNHALSMRQPGSIFKPFVYAAALATAIDGSSHVFTPVSTVVDEPATFRFGTQVYQPSNFEKRFYGTVTLRTALAHSLNVATVTLAEKIGYDRIVKLARLAGLNENILATPAVALGAYEASPLEMAGAYTVFANRGEYVRPTFISKVTAKGHPIVSGATERHRTLDPRITFLMTDMLQEVMRSGTAAGVRSLGFKAPAAGKTGTSRDGWFAGFTPDLVCVVWIGFDDNRELQLEGSKSALLVWAEFMKRAVQFHPVTRKFDPPPPGVVAMNVDSTSGLLPAADCGPSRAQYFISGTGPQSQCQPPMFPFGEDGGQIIMTSGTGDRGMSRPSTP
jgi:penicillin-binding protein 1B